jgi:hypothetical protein
LVVALLASAASFAGQGLDELHVDLYSVAGELLLVAFPATLVSLVLLGSGQMVHLQSFEDSPHARLADRDFVVAGEIHRDLGRAEVVVLT